MHMRVILTGDQDMKLGVSHTFSFPTGCQYAKEVLRVTRER